MGEHIEFWIFVFVALVLVYFAYHEPQIILGAMR